jgi:hypothetical protein
VEQATSRPGRRRSRRPRPSGRRPGRPHLRRRRRARAPPPARRRPPPSR